MIHVRFKQYFIINHRVAISPCPEHNMNPAIAKCTNNAMTLPVRQLITTAEMILKTKQLSALNTQNLASINLSA